MEVINWKENKEAGTVCFEARIPMKKTKIFMEFFHVSFQKIRSLKNRALVFQKYLLIFVMLKDLQG